MKISIIRILTLVIAVVFPMVGGDYDVLSFGAKADGVTDNSKFFLNAWKAACTSPVPAKLYVPNGTFMLLPVAFSGPCKSSTITVQIDGDLVASINYDLYSRAGYWLSFAQVSGLNIQGGNFNGNGTSLWACKNRSGSCPTGASTLLLDYVQNSKVTGVTSINSQLFHIVIDNSMNVAVDGANIIAAGSSPNTDGFHVEQSVGISITNASIMTGDDCVSIGPGTKNLWIQQVSCGPGHGISIGSLAKTATENGVQNVTVQDVVFAGSDNGLRIKSWERASTGFVKDVLFQKVIMKNVKNPIIIDQHYCPDNKGCPKESSSVKISQVTYINVQGTSATKVAVNFACAAQTPCQGLQLTDIQLTYNNNPSSSSCVNAVGNATGVMVPPSCL